MFKPYIQNQAFLIPPSFRDFLSDDHEAVILSELIDSLDLSGLYKSYRNTFRGTTAYDPGMLFKVLIYAYSHKTFSSRSIALRLHSDIAFMYLSGLQKPDFRTINRFRKEKGNILERIFLQIVHLAHEMGMISFGTLSLDGTKIYANASKEKNETLTSLEKVISGFLRDAEAIDAIEDEKFGDDDGRNIPEELKTKEGREKKLRELKEKKEKTEKLQEKLKERIESSAKYKRGWEVKKKILEQSKINTTDPEARLMQMKRKDYANGYNVQILTENQIILTSHVSSNPADYNELVPTLEKLENTIHQMPKCLLADTGYFSEENFVFLEREKIDAYIPPQTPEKEEAMENLVYSESEDVYLDADGNIFEFYQWGEKPDGTRKRGRPRKREEKIRIMEEGKRKKAVYVCKNYAIPGKKKFISINPEFERFRKEQKEKLSQEEWRMIFSKRKTDVETVFARTKYLLWFERCSLRWEKWAGIEWNMICMVHNLKKIMTFTLKQAG